ncbi:MAG: hypothetical protein R2813_07640 [Flavobacteriales bacterium]
MKRLEYLWSASLLIVIGLSSCQDKTTEKVTYTANVPVYASEQSLRELVGSEGPKELSGAGKMHIRGNYIYIVKPFAGIHVIDNSNPSSPQNVSFISLPGVLDIASYGFTLYADSYKDLVSLDISNPLSVKEVDRDEDVFQSMLPPTLNNYPIATIDETQGVVVDWKVEQITETREVDNWGRGWGAQEGLDFASTASEGSNVKGSDILLSAYQPVPGQSGSTARFTALNDQLYTVNGDQIKVFSLAEEQNPSEGVTVETGREVETIFPMENMLFLGTTTGMLVYGLNNPASPDFISGFNHATGCDPVVVEDSIAYVTLRTGTQCGGWANQLDVLDVRNITNPQSIASYQFTSPHGLGIDNNILFICDGSDGLKIYDATDKWHITDHPLAHYADIQAYDVIPLGDILLLIGEDGFYQYSYAEPQNITLLSFISTNN